MEGTVSQIFYLGLSFYFMPKIGKHVIKNVNINFEIEFIYGLVL